MRKRSFFIILSIVILFVFSVGVYSADLSPQPTETVSLLDETNESLLFGCCSIVCQLEGNDSIISFRRDSDYSADIHIEKVNWHGKPAIKQYKEDNGYFCQVIVTYDGWLIGYGGLDDGDDNKVIENMTANMVLNNTISNSTLQQIQDIKYEYGRGHALIKAPNGTYGVAMATTHFTGVLKPGDYISVPNKYSFVRTGDIQLNATDKIKIMNKLETSDGYGLLRRDVTTFYFHNVDNDTFRGNITDIYMSNDDGSFHGMSTGGLYDDIYFNKTLIKGSDLPIAPNYTKMGNISFEQEGTPLFGESDGLLRIFNVLMQIFAVILFIVVVVLVIRLINQIRYGRRRRR